LISLPLVLIILPANFFDSGQSICLSVLILDRECFGCGMTRAVQHLIHLDFIGAYNFNKLSFLVFPTVVYLLIKEILKIYFKLIIFNKKKL
jgi:hypothetical protein